MSSSLHLRSSLRNWGPQVRGQVRPARAPDLGRARRVRGGRVAGRPGRLPPRLEGTTFQRSFTEPGKHVLRLEAMALDELGVPGPVTVQAVEVDVRLPRTRWTEEPPKCLDDLVWIVPVDADWTHPDVPRRIEWRMAGWDWQPLPEDRRVPVARYNNQAVEFQFRAVEEGRFADPTPLVLKVAVEMSAGEGDRAANQAHLSGTEAERSLGRRRPQGGTGGGGQAAPQEARGAANLRAAMPRGTHGS